MKGQKLLTATQAAKELGVDSSWIRILISRGILRAEKLGEQWVLTENEIKNYQDNRNPVGRPPDPNKKNKSKKK
jgi:DNA (cytosine-5)-methyltransferase 1